MTQWTEADDKSHAMLRLEWAKRYALERMDQEEIDHITEVIRIIRDDVPASFFAGFGSFKGPKP